MERIMMVFIRILEFLTQRQQNDLSLRANQALVMAFV
jgi:hypothetical protein